MFKAPFPGYTSVSGITSINDVRSIAGGSETYTMAGFGSPRTLGRRLALTVLVTHETLTCERARMNPKRHVRGRDIGPIFEYAASSVPYAPVVFSTRRLLGFLWKVRGKPLAIDLKARCLRVISYESSRQDLADQLESLTVFGGRYLDAIRLRMAWPNPNTMRAFLLRHPRLRLVIQINSAAYDDVRRDPEELCRRLEAYRGGMTDILFEARNGFGTMLTTAELTRVIAALARTFPRCGICVAGGLTGGIARWPLRPGGNEQCITSLAPLFQQFPMLSVDAEGGTRDRNDDFDDVAAREYIRGVWKVFPFV